MTSAERRQNELAKIRAAGAALARTFPPLTEREIERLAFLIEPTAAPSRTPAALPQAA